MNVFFGGWKWSTEYVGRWIVILHCKMYGIGGTEFLDTYTYS
jgi:hypothetical protein